MAACGATVTAMEERDFERAQSAWRFRGADRPSFAVEPGPGEESVWDYPRPPRIEPDARRVRVLVEGRPIVDSTEAVRVLETASPPVFYIPRSDVAMPQLVDEGAGSICEWKGQATYWSVSAPGGETLRSVGWSYERPFAAFEAIRGYLSFYPGRVECYVGDQRVGPQPGGFYGGWVTPEIVGPFKGEPGTGGW